ncbi:unnamed protein product [Spirodela intermedia]|uniref:FLZ-type domain-containing protein n=1 Tax=Spirodela intermedia TaxID=51605 RepID=A0A7I8JKS4_SPIIN|nr:unnamed protein product [Spirodela intermedia]CAA6670375.1 unnamed protein product [Spirodela intermedia]
MMVGGSHGRRLFSAGLRSANKLSLLVGLGESFSSSPGGEGHSRPPGAWSPRNFDFDRAVGLGIVAAMNDGEPPRAAPVTKSAPPPTRSVPIPIVFATTGGQRGNEWSDEEETELSEGYTCVISDVGPPARRRRLGALLCGAIRDAPPPAWPSLLPPPEDFLNRCFRCGKKLHGLDIFMYRGEKAFCSAECRCQQMVSEEQREKKKPFDCSMSPCSATAPLFFPAGVAAA